MCKIKLSIISLLVGLISTNSYAALYGGVEFPQGEVSFADLVSDFISGPYGAANPYDNPDNALGAPDYVDVNSLPDTVVSLGHGGILDLRFTDNSLTTSGDASIDLWIFEVGPAVERTEVYISTSGVNWISLGAVAGSTSGIDIDAYVGTGVIPGELYSYVRLIDDPNDPNDTNIDGVWAGADIDAVGAISSGPPSVPIPPALWLFSFGLIGLIGIARRKTHV